MAFTDKSMKAVIAGSVVAPSLFSFNTLDTQAVVEGAGYFSEAAPFLQQNDIILCLMGAEGAKVLVKYIVSARVIHDDGTPHLLNVQAAPLWTGDTRDTDGIGFKSTNLSRGIGGADGLYNHYTFRNNSNTKAEIVAADYFLDARDVLEVGDIIEVASIEGASYLRVTAAGTTVTTEAIVLA